jgi:heme/copper-type cytochrome/quinol oxidase subunit 4
MVAAAAVTPAIGYWIPPRPPVSFHRYFIGLELIVFVVVIAFWLIPMLLRPLVPIQWVYALGSLFLSLRLYFILLILWPSLREIGFLKWAMACLVLALVVAGVMTYIRHVNSGIG